MLPAPAPEGPNPWKPASRRPLAQVSLFSHLSYRAEHVVSAKSPDAGQPTPREDKARRRAWVHSGPEQLLSTTSQGPVACCALMLGVPLCPVSRDPPTPGPGWGKVFSQRLSAQSPGLTVRTETWVSSPPRGRAVGAGPVG